MNPTNREMVDWFRHSAPYINAHRGRTFVVMLPGEALAHDNLEHTVHDIALLNSLGVKLVIALGARPQIDAALQRAGITSQYHHGMRITDQNVLAYVTEAVGAVRVKMEALLTTGLVNSPMHGAQIRAVSGNFVTAKPIGVRDGVDYLHTGEVRKIDAEAIQVALKQNAVVLLPCVGYSVTGEVFNLSVESVATEAATALRADKLIAYTRVGGVCDDKGLLLRELRPATAAHVINDINLDDDLRKPLRACYKAVSNGVPRAHLISYLRDGTLLEELFTRDGGGTLITQTGFEHVRVATHGDVAGIIELIRPLEEQGVLVRRSRELLENEIDHFTVIERDGMIIACIALYPYAKEGMGEIACVVTNPQYRGEKRAQVLLHHMEKRAKHAGIHRLFVLTTQTAHWFVEHGFAEANLEELPKEKQKLYNFQRNSKIFIKSI